MAMPLRPASDLYHRSPLKQNSIFQMQMTGKQKKN